MNVEDEVEHDTDLEVAEGVADSALCFVDHALSLARASGVRTLAIAMESQPAGHWIAARRWDERILWFVGQRPRVGEVPTGDGMVLVPASLRRQRQLRLGVYLALLDGQLDLDERFLFLSGRTPARFDTMILEQGRQLFPWLDRTGLERTRGLVGRRQFGRLLEVALRLAEEGREGKPVGTTFVLGELEELAPHTRPLILNPCAGHAASLRSIHRPEFVETLRELSALDGAIIVNQQGVVESAGTYLDAPAARLDLRSGQGARHAAAAAITACTDSVAIVISESSQCVSVFDDGRPVLELDRNA